MSSAYSIGKRIALDFCYENEEEALLVKENIEKVIKECNKYTTISTHFITTNSRDWNSVVKYDHFFKNVELLKKPKEFIDLIRDDLSLKGTDIAKYILSKFECTHLKLEKLVYMCYADYLCNTHKKLFNDNIYAYRLGPVIDTVYSKYKKYGYEKIDNEDVINMVNNLELPSRSRILASKDGVEKLISIEETLRKYGNKTASELITLTHKKSSPWDRSGAGTKSNEKISDEAIIKYHHVETL